MTVDGHTEDLRVYTRHAHLGAVQNMAPDCLPGPRAHAHMAHAYYFDAHFRIRKSKYS